MNEYLKDPKKLSRWIEEIARQDMIYPENYIKLRSFENHDQERLRSKVKNHAHFMQMMALMFFLKGPAFIYAGQEHEISQKPSLFENDLIPWNSDHSIETFIKRLSSLKKQLIFAKGNFNLHHSMDAVVISYAYQNQFLVGIFNLEGLTSVEVPLIDGNYTNFINDEDIVVEHGKIEINNQPIIIDTLKEHIK